jgi:hypothetical protein
MSVRPRAPIINAMQQTYPVVLPIETNHGRGETRRIGPTRLTFATPALFAAGEVLRFAIALRGTDAKSIDLVGSGSVRAVTTDGELFVVEASIDQTRITFATSEERQKP